MRKRLLTAAALLALLAVLTGCAGKGTDRDLVYEDMKEAFESSGLLSANVGIYSKTEEDGSVSYGEGGSGVIIRREGNTYYALTAAHVVSAENAELLVFTVYTERKTEQIPGVDYDVISQETYESMAGAEAVFVSKRDDLAVIRFTADGDLAVMELADGDPEKGDRILCVGNPQNEWFCVTCGKVLSGIETFGESTGFPSNAMRHSAYINVGSSGGAAVDERMRLAGITPGASISPDGKTVYYGVLIPVSEIRLCLEDWNG